MLIGISGLAGSGKDTVADFLVAEHKFVKVSFADPLKRICQDVFEFTDEQLWGPSEKRNAPDPRFPRGKVLDEDTTRELFLTPRYALQQLGTEWGRDCYGPIWVEYAVRIHDKLQKGSCCYDKRFGLRPVTEWDEIRPKKNVVIADVRFKNEIEGLRERGATLIRVLRPVSGLTGEAAKHLSETEQREIPDSLFDHVIDNSGSLKDLETKVHTLFAGLQ